MNVSLPPSSNSRPSALGQAKRSYGQRTPDDYLALLAEEERASFSADQLDSIRTLLRSAIPQPSPKIVDLRFDIDLLLSRFYVVLFVGKDRRQQRRSPVPRLLTRIGNIAIAIMLLIGINLLFSVCLFIFLYLVKSALSIDIFQGAHLVDQVNRFR